MTSYRSITGACHAHLATRVQAGDRVLDATAGNGGDTLALARLVGNKGHVWSLDRQSAALCETRRRLIAEGCLDRCTLLQGEHAAIETAVPPATQSGLAAVVFNLGYLPGGDKQIATDAASTLHALEETWKWLRPEGCLSVVCYPGHAAGEKEAAAVFQWLNDRAARTGQKLEKIDAGPTRRPAPFLLTLARRPA